MARASRKFGHFGRQLTIRDYLSLDPTDQLKVAMSEALKNCEMSRAAVADAMNSLAASAGMRNEGPNGRITETILDKWVSRASRANQIPVRYIPIFCQATGSLLPIQAILPPGAEVIGSEDSTLLKWAEVETRRRRLARESRRLAQEAGIE